MKIQKHTASGWQEILSADEESSVFEYICSSNPQVACAGIAYYSIDGAVYRCNPFGAAKL